MRQGRNLRFASINLSSFRRPTVTQHADSKGHITQAPKCAAKSLFLWSRHQDNLSSIWSTRRNVLCQVAAKEIVDKLFWTSQSISTRVRWEPIGRSLWRSLLGLRVLYNLYSPCQVVETSEPGWTLLNLPVDVSQGRAFDRWKLNRRTVGIEGTGMTVFPTSAD